MTPEKRQRLEAAGYRISSAADFLGMTPDEAALMEIRFALRQLLKKRRAEADLSQTELAARLKTSQPRVSKIEAADPTVSTDLLLRALLLAGASPVEIGETIAAASEKTVPTSVEEEVSAR